MKKYLLLFFFNTLPCTGPIPLLKNEENFCSNNSSILLLYSIPEFTELILKTKFAPKSAAYEFQELFKIFNKTPNTIHDARDFIRPNLTRLCPMKSTDDIFKILQNNSQIEDLVKSLFGITFNETKFGITEQKKALLLNWQPIRITKVHCNDMPKTLHSFSEVFSEWQNRKSCRSFRDEDAIIIQRSLTEVGNYIIISCQVPANKQGDETLSFPLTVELPVNGQPITFELHGLLFGTFNHSIALVQHQGKWYECDDTPPQCTQWPLGVLQKFAHDGTITNRHGACTPSLFVYKKQQITKSPATTTKDTVTALTQLAESLQQLSR